VLAKSEFSCSWPAANDDFNIFSPWPVLAPRNKIPGPSKNQVSISEFFLLQILIAGVINKEQANPATECMAGVKHKHTS